MGARHTDSWTRASMTTACADTSTMVYFWGQHYDPCTHLVIADRDTQYSTLAPWLLLSYHYSPFLLASSCLLDCRSPSPSAQPPTCLEQQHSDLESVDSTSAIEYKYLNWQLKYCSVAAVRVYIASGVFSARALQTFVTLIKHTLFLLLFIIHGCFGHLIHISDHLAHHPIQLKWHFLIRSLAFTDMFVT